MVYEAFSVYWKRKLHNWLFRILISASIRAACRITPHESALLSTSCRLCGCRRHARHDSWTGLWTSDAMVCILTPWLHQRSQEEMASSKGMDFYALSWATFRKPAGTVVETAQQKSQARCPRCAAYGHWLDYYEIYYNEQWLHPALTHLRPDPMASATAAWAAIPFSCGEITI